MTNFKRQLTRRRARHAWSIVRDREKLLVKRAQEIECNLSKSSDGTYSLIRWKSAERIASDLTLDEAESFVESARGEE